MKMHFQTRTIHDITISDLEQVTNAEVLASVTLRPLPFDESQPELSEDDFSDEWSGEVTKQAIDLLPMYDKLEDCRFYLGHFVADGTMTAIAESEMPNYGVDVTYNGWRVTVSCAFVTWGLD